MTAHLLWLQLPFLYIPMLLIGLAIYGADFEHPSGQIYQWTPLVLVILHYLLRAFGRSLARPRIAGPVLIACTLVVAIAYRPLHMDWWDERSTTQAVHILAVGVCSLLASHIGSRRIAEQGGPRANAAAGSFLVLAGIATTAVLYPMLPLLGLAPLMAAGAVAATTAAPERAPQLANSTFGGWRRYAVMLVALELFLPLWDLQTDTRWGCLFGLGLLGIGLGLLWSHRAPFAAIFLPAIGLLLVLASAWSSELLISPVRTILIGAACGWLLLPALHARADGDRPASLQWCPPLWMLGIALGFVFSANRAFLPLRVLLLLPLLIPLLALLRQRASRPAA